MWRRGSTKGRPKASDDEPSLFLTDPSPLCPRGAALDSRLIGPWHLPPETPTARSRQPRSTGRHESTTSDGRPLASKVRPYSSLAPVKIYKAAVFRLIQFVLPFCFRLFQREEEALLQPLVARADGGARGRAIEFGGGDDPLRCEQDGPPPPRQKPKREDADAALCPRPGLAVHPGTAECPIPLVLVGDTADADQRDVDAILEIIRRILASPPLVLSLRPPYQAG